jgi:hypothetical protein
MNFCLSLVLHPKGHRGYLGIASCERTSNEGRGRSMQYFSRYLNGRSD